MDRPNDIWFADEPEVQQDLRLSGEHFLGRLDGENSRGEPVPEDLVRNCTPLRLQGAALFQSKNCRNCHALDGSGGKRGPDLTTVGLRLTRDQLIDQISNGTPGGGNMPAYGKQISPAEMTALVEFLTNLRPLGKPAAKPASARDDEKEYP